MVILWDVMDTLVRDPFREVMPRFFGVDFKGLLRAKSATAWPDFECGRLTEAEYFARAFTDGRVFDGDAFREAMVAGYEWLPGMEALLADLAHAGLEMHALSNYPCWYERLDENLGLSRYLTWRFVSCRTGLRKPAPEAYLNAARGCGVSPAECVFIDDRPENVTAARAVGMEGVVTEGAEQIRAALRGLGLP